jgi:hypothetical protein
MSGTELPYCQACRSTVEPLGHWDEKGGCVTTQLLRTFNDHRIGSDSIEGINQWRDDQALLVSLNRVNIIKEVLEQNLEPILAGLEEANMKPAEATLFLFKQTKRIMAQSQPQPQPQPQSSNGLPTNVSNRLTVCLEKVKMEMDSIDHGDRDRGATWDEETKQAALEQVLTDCLIWLANELALRRQAFGSSGLGSVGTELGLRNLDCAICLPPKREPTESAPLEVKRVWLSERGKAVIDCAKLVIDSKLFTLDWLRLRKSKKTGLLQILLCRPEAEVKRSVRVDEKTWATLLRGEVNEAVECLMIPTCVGLVGEETRAVIKLRRVNWVASYRFRGEVRLDISTYLTGIEDKADLKLARVFRDAKEAEVIEEKESEKCVVTTMQRWVVKGKGGEVIEELRTAGLRDVGDWR